MSDLEADYSEARGLITIGMTLRDYAAYLRAAVGLQDDLGVTLQREVWAEVAKANASHPLADVVLDVYSEQFYVPTILDNTHFAKYRRREPDPGACLILDVDWEKRKLGMTNGSCRYHPDFDEIELLLGDSIQFMVPLVGTA